MLVLGWTGGPPRDTLNLVPTFRAAEVGSARPQHLSISDGPVITKGRCFRRPTPLRRL